jgi:hypothetical protein
MFKYLPDVIQGEHMHRALLFTLTYVYIDLPLLKEVDTSKEPPEMRMFTKEELSKYGRYPLLR